jgi:hypothetical protein
MYISVNQYIKTSALLYFPNIDFYPHKPLVILHLIAMTDTQIIILLGCAP